MRRTRRVPPERARGQGWALGSIWPRVHQLYRSPPIPHPTPCPSQLSPLPFPFPPLTLRYLLACAPSPSRIPCTLVAPCDVSMVSCADRRPVDQLLPALCAVGRVTDLFIVPSGCRGEESSVPCILWLYHCIVISSVYLMRVRAVCFTGVLCIHEDSEK